MAIAYHRIYPIKFAALQTGAAAYNRETLAAVGAVWTTVGAHEEIRPGAFAEMMEKTYPYTIDIFIVNAIKTAGTGAKFRLLATAGNTTWATCTLSSSNSATFPWAAQTFAVPASQESTNIRLQLQYFATGPVEFFGACWERWRKQ